MQGPMARGSQLEGAVSGLCADDGGGVAKAYVDAGGGGLCLVGEVGWLAFEVGRPVHEPQYQDPYVMLLRMDQPEMGPASLCPWVAACEPTQGHLGNARWIPDESYYTLLHTAWVAAPASLGGADRCRASDVSTE